MLSPVNMLFGRSPLARRAHHGLPNVLKARFSPTAIWTTESEDAETAIATRSIDTEPLIQPPTRQTTTSVALTTRITTPSTTSSTATSTLPQTTSSSTVSVTTTTSSSSSSSTNVAVVRTTSSTTSSISSTGTSITPTTTPTTTLAATTQTTARVTRTVSSAAVSSAPSSASATSTSTESSGISTVGVVGIVAAGIVGAVVLASMVMFFVRRRNRKRDEYDPEEFKRQSVMLPDDDAPLQRGNSGRGGPRPPTMFERHNQNISAFAAIPTTYQSTGNSYGPANPFNDYSSQVPPSFAPGMYVHSPTASPAPMAQYANASPYYNPTSQSPVGSPVTVASYGGAAYDAYGNLIRSPSNGAASMLSRNNSVLPPDENPDYLTRASVTPFQAAQYAAISKQLNIPPPQPLQQVSEVEETEVTNRANQDNSLAVQNAASASVASPFEDPQVGPTQIAAVSAVADDNSEKIEPSRPSSEFHSAPEPAVRVPSTPPSLPEIKMMSGSFSPVTYNFPVTPSPRKGSFDVASGRASPKVDLPPLSPSASSPQRAQFVEGLEARAHDGHETPVEIGFIGKGESVLKADVQPSVQIATQAEQKVEVPNTEAPKAAVPKRPETVYSDEDAYGGF